MSRQITLLDILYKLDRCYSRNTLQVTKDDLCEVYMTEPGWPIMASEGTFNEKIRTLLRLQVLVPIKAGKKIFVIKWDRVDQIITNLKDEY